MRLGNSVQNRFVVVNREGLGRELISDVEQQVVVVADRFQKTAESETYRRAEPQLHLPLGVKVRPQGIANRFVAELD